MADHNRKRFFLGIIFLVFAMVAIVAAFSLTINAHRSKLAEMNALKEQVDVLTMEKTLAVQKASDLANKLGESIHLGKLLDEANKVYDEKEKGRHEGNLWIDRDQKTLIVTLGAVNGLTQGSRVKILDGDKPVGYVKVETPLDVISYVQPLNQSLDAFEGDYYRAVFEE